MCALLGYSFPPFSSHFLSVLFNSEPWFPSWLVYLSWLWYSELKSMWTFHEESQYVAADAAVHTWKVSLLTQLVPWRGSEYHAAVRGQISRCCCLLLVKPVLNQPLHFTVYLHILPFLPGTLFFFFLIEVTWINNIILLFLYTLPCACPPMFIFHPSPCSWPFVLNLLSLPLSLPLWSPLLCSLGLHVFVRLVHLFYLFISF